MAKTDVEVIVVECSSCGERIACGASAAAIMAARSRHRCAVRRDGARETLEVRDATPCAQSSETGRVTRC